MTLMNQLLGPHFSSGDSRGKLMSAKKRAEIAKARPGENAPQAIITCIEAAMRSSSYAIGWWSSIQAAHGWRPGQDLAVHILRGTCVIQNPRLDSEAGSA